MMLLNWVLLGYSNNASVDDTCGDDNDYYSIADDGDV